MAAAMKALLIAFIKQHYIGIVTFYAIRERKQTGKGSAASQGCFAIMVWCSKDTDRLKNRWLNQRQPPSSLFRFMREARICKVYQPPDLYDCLTAFPIKQMKTAMFFKKNACFQHDKRINHIRKCYIWHLPYILYDITQLPSLLSAALSLRLLQSLPKRRDKKLQESRILPSQDR